jgi:hypothetical protein
MGIPGWASRQSESTINNEKQQAILPPSYLNLSQNWFLTKIRHARESGHPEKPEKTGFPFARE